MRVDARKIILTILRKHPEGLTIQQIANLSGMNRLTVTKYIFELTGADIVYQRQVGRARLCYLRKKFSEKVREEEILELLKKKLKGS